MILISVDLPAPLGPTMPIFAPEIELQVDVVQNRLLRAGEGFGHAFHDIGILRTAHGGSAPLEQVVEWIAAR
jgi:hypothetical protein